MWVDLPVFNWPFFSKPSSSLNYRSIYAMNIILWLGPSPGWCPLTSFIMRSLILSQSTTYMQDLLPTAESLTQWWKQEEFIYVPIQVSQWWVAEDQSEPSGMPRGLQAPSLPSSDISLCGLSLFYLVPHRHKVSCVFTVHRISVLQTEMKGQSKRTHGFLKAALSFTNRCILGYLDAIATEIQPRVLTQFWLWETLGKKKHLADQLVQEKAKDNEVGMGDVWIRLWPEPCICSESRLMDCNSWESGN